MHILFPGSFWGCGKIAGLIKIPRNVLSPRKFPGLLEHQTYEMIVMIKYIYVKQLYTENDKTLTRKTKNNALYQVEEVFFYSWFESFYQDVSRILSKDF